MKWLVVTLLGVGLAAYVLFGGSYCQTEEYVARREDSNNLRQITSLLVARSSGGKLPMKDGALDVYALFRNGEVVGTNLKVFRSAQSGTGPTDEEVERGDYTNFPWERYRGEGRLDGPPFPILWEKTPDEKGGRLVALSNGSARLWERAEFETALREQPR